MHTINKQQERARLDSLNKIWNDSLAKTKAREAELLAQRSEQDKLNAEKEKARQDSIIRANAAAAAAATAASFEKARRDSIELANEKAKSLAEAKEKERQDSIARADSEAQKRSQMQLQRPPPLQRYLPLKIIGKILQPKRKLL